MEPPPKSINRLRRWMRRLVYAFCGGVLLIVGLVALLFFVVNRPPKSYPASTNPIEPPSRTDYARFQLDAFESPYLGHTGSANGQGGTMFGGSKEKEMDKEVDMGLRWTFLPVNWRKLEPHGRVNLTNGVPAPWKQLDEFVISAERRKLNILCQAPVVGGNAEGPPEWAGRRESGKSAPVQMDALAEFAGKLARRYKPGGTLALEQGWGSRFGVRAWEIDNEPEMYRTHWNGQAGDYAEMATKVAAKIKVADPLALIVLAGVASGKSKEQWLEDALNAQSRAGSPAYRSNALPYSIGPVGDVVSFHVYEGLDSAFGGGPRTIEVVLDEVRSIFEGWEKRSDGFHYDRKKEYWQTEGNFDFIGALSEQRRAAWRIQFFTRAFAAGVRKVCVMDASKGEAAAIRSYIEALPWPFPMQRLDDKIETLTAGAKVTAYRHMDGSRPEDGEVWILWVAAGNPGARVKVPITSKLVTVVQTDGTKANREAKNGQVTLELVGDKKMAPPLIVIDRAASAEKR